MVVVREEVECLRDGLAGWVGLRDYAGLEVELMVLVVVVVVLGLVWVVVTLVVARMVADC